METNDNVKRVESLCDLEGVISEDVLGVIRKEHGAFTDENFLTELQKEAFSDEDFWKDEKNIIIRGRTSSGKTLVAEIAAAYFGGATRMDIEENKIIYLVPLRVMVEEKKREFEIIFQTIDWKVYASSSDYQDNDEDIIAGDFKIAVMVYEKFFALLAQDNQFVKQCALIIVDELQMISREDRGAKLEVALTKIGIVNPQCKIMGLTTLQCEVSYLKRWLNAKEIRSLKRPKGLHEYIVWPDVKDDAKNDQRNNNRHQFYYYMNEETQDGENNVQEHGMPRVLDEDRVINPIFQRGECEKSIVVELIGSIIEKKRKDVEEGVVNPKILVFLNHKRAVESLAENIGDYLRRNNIWTRQVTDRSDERIIDLQESGEEENINVFLGKIWPYRVAYHHSGLPKVMREFVEEEFRKSNGSINIVVATETLAIGINMPADIVILVGVDLPRAGNKNNKMTSSEYKNYIGRAGRLGKSAAKVGESYLIAPSRRAANNYWGKYVKAKPTNITSFIAKLDNRQSATFALNLVLCNPRALNVQGQLEIDEYKNAMDQLFFNYCTGDHKDNLEGGKDLEISENKKKTYENQLEELKKAGLLERSSNQAVGQNTYIISRMGELLARYALDLTTVNLLKMLRERSLDFYRKEIETRKDSDGSIKNQKKIFLKYFDKYILDILFELCMAPEVNGGIDIEDNAKYTDKAVQYLIKKKGELPEDGRLKIILDEYETMYKQLPNRGNSIALKNAIILYEWSQGKCIRDIRKNTGLDYVREGDVDRLGDVVAYLWEAMAYSFQGTGDVSRFCNSLANYSGKIKYGVPESIVLLASRHVPYLSRKRLMTIKEEAESRKIDPISFVRNRANASNTVVPERIFIQLNNALLAYYRRKGEGSEFESWCKKNLISDEIEEALRQYEEEKCLSFSNLRTLLQEREWGLEIQQDESDERMGIITDLRNGNMIAFYLFDSNIHNEWIRQVRGKIEDVKKRRAIQKSVFLVVALQGEKDRNADDIEQLTYEVFVQLYKTILAKIGNLIPLFDILTMPCEHIGLDDLDIIAGMYTDREFDDELHSDIQSYFYEHMLRDKNLIVKQEGDGTMIMKIGTVNGPVTTIDQSGSKIYGEKIETDNSSGKEVNIENKEIKEMKQAIQNVDGINQSQIEEITKILDEMNDNIDSLKRDAKESWMNKLANAATIGSGAATILTSSLWNEFYTNVANFFARLPG